jgi:translation initiation factor 2 subunit 1
MGEAYELIGWPIKEQFDFYQEAVEALKEEGKEILDDLENIPEDVKRAFLKVVDENVEISTVNIIGKLKLVNTSGDGVDKIKDTLNEVIKVIETPTETRNLTLSYIGAPFYRLDIVSKDYLDAENILSNTLEVLESVTLQNNGKFEFVRD